MTTSQTEIRAFFSWQSDLPDQSNRAFIRATLRTAATALEAKYPSVRFYNDEATRGKAGSPNIPLTILHKIDEADIFIADVSTINSGDAAKSLRACPNPNVVFELGYAVAQVGWSRIILLFNDQFGTLKDLPFDFDRHRASAYTMDPAFDTSRTKNAQKNLAELLEVALESILLNKPPRPAESTRDPEAIKRRRDITRLVALLRFINFDAIREMTSIMPQRLEHKIFIFWDAFEAAWSAPELNFYDRNLHRILSEVHNAWKALISNGECYQLLENSTHRYAWTAAHPVPTRQQAIARRNIEDTCPKLNRLLVELSEIIHQYYLEVDLLETKRASWAWYRSEVGDLDLD